MAIDVLPQPLWRWMASVVGAVRRKARGLPGVSPHLSVEPSAPESPLGSLRDAIFWRHENIQRWIEAGRQAAQRVRNI